MENLNYFLLFTVNKSVKEFPIKITCHELGKQKDRSPIGGDRPMW